MFRFRARTAAAALVVASALAWTLRGHAQDAAPPLQITDVGLPAVEQPGAIWSESRVPWTPAGRAARVVTAEPLRRGAYGRQYVTGKVIVRFRDEVSDTERRGLVRDASGTADLMPRRAFADFDVLRIDPSEDAEAVAASL